MALLSPLGWCQYIETQVVTASDGDYEDSFGSVDLDHQGLMVVGAPGDDYSFFTSAGAVYVYEESASGWTEKQKLIPSDPGNKRFGQEVSIEGDSIAIAAPEEEAHDGAVYLFARQSGVWVETQKISVSTAGPNANFGVSLDLDNNRLVVGAYLATAGGVSSSGSVFVFEHDGSSWKQTAHLVASDALSGGLFGQSISLDGDRIVVGSPGWGPNSMASSWGRVYIFEYSGSSWIESGSVQPGTPSGKAYFGSSVCLQGDAFVAGAWNQDVGQIKNAGAAYVFRRDSLGVWVQESRLVASDADPNDFFGNRVAIRDGRIIAGAHNAGPGTINTNTGAAYLFQRDLAGAWEEHSRLMPSSPGLGDSFGAFVALSGCQAFVGAFRWDPPASPIVDQGAVFVYDDKGLPRVYCTAGVSSHGCQATISSTGVASATAGNGFVLASQNAGGLTNGLFFVGTSSPALKAWGNGTSFLCFDPPFRRASPVLTSGGVFGACNGVFMIDLNSQWCPGCPKAKINPGGASIVRAQLWYRDSANTSNVNSVLSDAIEFCVTP